MNRNNPRGGDRSHRLAPEILHVVGRLRAEAADTEEHGIGRKALQGAFNITRAAHDQPTALRVTDMQYIRRAHAVIKHAYRWHQRRTDQRLAQRPLADCRVGKFKMPRLDGSNHKLPQLHRLAINQHLYLRFGQTPATANIGGGFGAQQQRAGTPGNLGRIHGVIVMRMQRQHRRQFGDMIGRQTLLNRLQVRADFAQQQAQRTGAGEPAVGHPLCLTIAEQQGCGAAETHRDGAGRNSVRSRAAPSPDLPVALHTLTGHTPETVPTK